MLYLISLTHLIPLFYSKKEKLWKTICISYKMVSTNHVATIVTHATSTPQIRKTAEQVLTQWISKQQSPKVNQMEATDRSNIIKSNAATYKVT